MLQSGDQRHFCHEFKVGCSRRCREAYSRKKSKLKRKPHLLFMLSALCSSLEKDFIVTDFE
jgi:hypothetical protein